MNTVVLQLPPKNIISQAPLSVNHQKSTLDFIQGKEQ